jgi:hypothetical protein
MADMDIDANLVVLMAEIRSLPTHQQAQVTASLAAIISALRLTLPLVSAAPSPVRAKQPAAAPVARS